VLHREKSSASEFWIHFFSMETVQWDLEIRNLVRIVFALPVSTAEVERGFSILKHIRYDRRSRLTPDTLKDIMFLRINGPSVSNFNPQDYVKKWIKAGRFSSDDPRDRGKQKPNNSSDIEFSIF